MFPAFLAPPRVEVRLLLTFFLFLACSTPMVPPTALPAARPAPTATEPGTFSGFLGLPAAPPASDVRAPAGERGTRSRLPGLDSVSNPLDFSDSSGPVSP